jgi:hypothetical protein
MSSQLPTIDISTAVVGSQYVLDFTAFVKFNPANISQNANLAIYNESGCGLLCSMQQSGTQFFVPAGGWGVSPISPNDSTCRFAVQYIISGAPVNSLLATYYAPNEQVPQSYTLGNSPIGGQVNVPGGISSQVINTGNPTGTTVLSGQPTGDSQAAVSITNDGIVSIGDALHGGSLAVVGTTTFGGRVQGNGTNNLQLDTGNVTRAITFNSAGVQKGFFDNVGLTMNGNLNMASGYVDTDFPINGHEIKATANNTLFLGNTTAGFGVQLRTIGAVRFGVTDNGAFLGSGTLSLLVGSLSRIQIITGLTVNNGASQTFSHSLGAVPDAIISFSQGTTNGNFTITSDNNGGSSTTFRLATSFGSPITPVTAILIKT